jgi:hypothetical protein
MGVKVPIRLCSAVSTVKVIICNAFFVAVGIVVGVISPDQNYWVDGPRFTSAARLFTIAARGVSMYVLILSLL